MRRVRARCRRRISQPRLLQPRPPQRAEAAQKQLPPLPSRTKPSPRSPTPERTGDIVEIEGIGPAYADKLRAAGVPTIDALLEKGATPEGRAALVEETGIDSVRVLRWVNHADLIRVVGVGPQYAELLEAAGVDSVPELAQRNVSMNTAA